MNFAKNLRVPLLALVAAAVAAIPASASNLAWNFTGTESFPSGGSGAAGNYADVFTVNSNTLLTAVGLPSGDGDYGVGGMAISVFDSLGNPLSGVNNLNINPGAPITPVGGYFWVSTIGSVALTAGQTYTIVVWNDGSNPAWGENSSAPTPGWATYDSSLFDAGFTNMVIEPTDTVSNKFDINMQGTVVPEPESLFLLGSGLISLAGFARLKLRKQ